VAGVKETSAQEQEEEEEEEEECALGPGTLLGAHSHS